MVFLSFDFTLWIKIGLFLEGRISAGEVISLYPGVVYHPGDPLFFPSIRNSFVLRRSDGVSIDGKGWGLSKFMFNSLASLGSSCLGFQVVILICRFFLSNWYHHHYYRLVIPLGWGKMFRWTLGSILWLLVKLLITTLTIRMSCISNLNFNETFLRNSDASFPTSTITRWMRIHNPIPAFWQQKRLFFLQQEIFRMKNCFPIIILWVGGLEAHLIEAQDAVW